MGRREYDFIKFIYFFKKILHKGNLSVQSLRDPSPVSPSSLRLVSTPLLSSPREFAHRLRRSPSPPPSCCFRRITSRRNLPSRSRYCLLRSSPCAAAKTNRGEGRAAISIWRAEQSSGGEGILDTNAAGPETVGNPDPMDQTEDNSMPSAQEQELAIKKKFGGLMPKKPPLISKDHERAYFDSADWALGKSGQQGAAKPKGPLEALRPKLQPTRQQQQRSRRLINTSSENEDGDGAGAEDMNIN
uniref:Negatively light-regulated protein n=1 Tax=Oryza rufipogon TaxID=4529 RepID=A0A0E0MTX7_ORYRU